MAVAFDAYGTGLGGSGSSWNHTIGAVSDRALLAFVYSTATVTGMTYNGVAMTQLSHFIYSGFPMDIWGILNPATGTNAIAVAGGGGIYSDSMSFAGVGSFGDFSQNPDVTVNCAASDMAAFVASALDTGCANRGAWALGGVLETITGSPSVTAANSFTGVQLVAVGGAPPDTSKFFNFFD